MFLHDRSCDLQKRCFFYATIVHILFWEHLRIALLLVRLFYSEATKRRDEI